MAPPIDDPQSAASSTASETADTGGLLGDAGPDFDAGAAAGPPPTPEVAVALTAAELWNEQRVKGVLTSKGVLLHGVLAVDRDSGEWLYTQADLAAIAPPLTRILNRYDATRAAAAAGDELMLAIGFGGYAARSWSERQRALKLARAGEPITGHPAEPGSGPEDDEEYMATVHPEHAIDADLEWPGEGDTPPIGGRR